MYYCPFYNFLARSDPDSLHVIPAKLCDIGTQESPEQFINSCNPCTDMFISSDLVSSETSLLPSLSSSTSPPDVQV